MVGTELVISLDKAMAWIRLVLISFPSVARARSASVRVTDVELLEDLRIQYFFIHKSEISVTWHFLI